MLLCTLFLRVDALHVKLSRGGSGYLRVVRTSRYKVIGAGCELPQGIPPGYRQHSAVHVAHLQGNEKLARICTLSAQPLHNCVAYIRQNAGLLTVLASMSSTCAPVPQQGAADDNKDYYQPNHPAA